ncbi:MAG TPA: HEAT repeat domain-containing protein [Pirellulales bacterium]|nr:HEAT repeat domain-containing protein [Pirellulales bacterium]
MSRRISSLLAAVVASAAGLVFAPGRAAAETIVLETGGRIEGEIVNDKESQRETYVIQTASGGRVTLARSQVKEVIRQTEAELEYEKIRPQYPDTVEGQWELAAWCRDHNLQRLRDKHLERIIELEPMHKEAHRLLEHVWDPQQGQWKTKKGFWEDQGYVFYQGDWMTSQEVELKERTRKNELAVKEWKRRLKLWRGWLGTDRREEALGSLAEIDDPYAVAALAEYLAKETDESVRIRYIEALARVGTPAASRVLAEFSLHDESEEVRLTCLDYLDDDPPPEAVDFYIKRLKDANNKVVNRAGLGLMRMGSRRAIGPLIDSLITRHKHVVPAQSMGNTSASFGTGGGGFSFGSAPPKVLNVPYKNQDVLQALVHLGGGPNYSYDVDSWKAWWATQRRAQSLNARRD